MSTFILYHIARKVSVKFVSRAHKINVKRLKLIEKLPKVTHRERNKTYRELWLNAELRGKCNG